LRGGHIGDRLGDHIVTEHHAEAACRGLVAHGGGGARGDAQSGDFFGL
jgi:hypothetical protein